MKTTEKNRYFISPMAVLSIIPMAATLFKIKEIADAWLLVSLIAWMLIHLLVVFVFRKNEKLTFLLATVPIIIVVRAADQNDLSLVGWTAALSFIPLIMLFVSISVKIYRESAFEFALTIVRIFLGMNFLTHCTEKLFAGTQPHDALLGFFGEVVGANSVGTWFTEVMVYAAGCIEFIVALSIGLGLFTRLGALLAMTYLTMATLLGNHFTNGYTWAVPGGGWEFPFFWFMLLAPFLVKGLDMKLSLSHILRNKS